MRYVEVEKKFKVRVKSLCFFKKNQFFLNLQNETIKYFQNVSNPKKLMKLERTHYKKKVWSPKFFQKNQNWILNSGPKFSNFQKMVILHKKWLKSSKSSKLSKFFMSILKGFKWFSEKYSREQKALFYHSLSIFHFFLAL